MSSLFQYGLRRVIQDPDGEETENTSQPAAHMPTIGEAGLGSVEYRRVSTVVTNPSPAKRSQYSAKQRAMIGKCALENGNENARRQFTGIFPSLKLRESSIGTSRKPIRRSWRLNRSRTA